VYYPVGPAAPEVPAGPRNHTLKKMKKNEKK
jgi:hypothetical protein